MSQNEAELVFDAIFIGMFVDGQGKLVFRFGIAADPAIPAAEKIVSFPIGGIAFDILLGERKRVLIIGDGRVCLDEGEASGFIIRFKLESGVVLVRRLSKS